MASTLETTELIGIKDIHDALEDALPSYAWFWGSRALGDKTVAYPRVVTIPRGGPISSGHMRSRTAPKCFGTRSPQLGFHLWGESPAECESMLSAVAEACDALCQGRWNPVSEDWPVLGEDWCSCGDLLVFIARFEIPILSTPLEVAQAESLEIIATEVI